MILVRRRPSAKSKHLRGLARAGAYVVALSLGLGAFQLRAARAEMKDRTVELGRQMMQLARATDHDVNKLSLNGQPIWIGSSTTSDSVEEVLGRYEGACKASAAQPSEDWRELATRAAAKKADPSRMPDGVMRAGTPEEGTIVCFTRGSASRPTLKEALTSFVETGELGALGNLRYVYAHTSARGKTTVLTAWTDDTFNLAELAPPDGEDARGADFPGLPRPEGAQRIFAAKVEGTPFGVNVYRSKQPPERAIAFYEAEMGKAGWRGVDPELERYGDEGARETRATARLYEKDGAVLTVASHVKDGDTVTALGLAGVTSSDGAPTEIGRKPEGAPRAPLMKRPDEPAREDTSTGPSQ
jgi:hypothetical protein